MNEDHEKLVQFLLAQGYEPEKAQQIAFNHAEEIRRQMNAVPVVDNFVAMEEEASGLKKNFSP